MRIEPNRSFSPSISSEPQRLSTLSDRSVFRDALQSFFASTPESQEPHFVRLQLSLESPVLGGLSDLNPRHLEKNFQIEELEDEMSEDLEVLEEVRDDAFLDDIEENQENMERLVDRWEEDGIQVKEGDDLDVPEGKEDLTDPIDGDESVDPELELSDAAKHFSEEKASKDALLTKKTPGVIGENNSAKDRELDYQEIQMLVDTVLNSKKYLSPRVRSILQQLLSSLLDGGRWLLDQHRLLSLDSVEWTQIRKMFPRHFYGGLLYTSYQLTDKQPIYEIFQQSFVQKAPNRANQEIWFELLTQAMGTLPLFIRQWIFGASTEPPDKELGDWLEIWKTLNALPPGASGRTLQLAFDYRHHPETMHQLFQLAQSYFHARPLFSSQYTLAANSIVQRCFPAGLLADVRMTDIVEQALRSESLEEDKLLKLLQGCSQSVLSYLPCGYLHKDLQAIVEYVYRDLMGQEEQVPGMLKDSAFGLTS